MKREVMETPAELLACLLTALSAVRITRADLFHQSTTPKGTTHEQQCRER